MIYQVCMVAMYFSFRFGAIYFWKQKKQLLTLALTENGHYFHIFDVVGLGHFISSTHTVAV